MIKHKSVWGLCLIRKIDKVKVAKVNINIYIFSVF